MTGIITLNLAGVDSGPFNLFSNVNGYTSAFAVNITRAQLIAGYPTDAIPNGTTIIRIISIGACPNYIDIVVPPQECYNFLPTDSYYLLDTISESTYAYAYGSFDGYIENGIATTYKNLIKLNVDLTIDTIFNVGTGFNEILYTGSSILEQPDGKIIVTGTFTTYQGITQNRIVRLNTDATVDVSFVTGTGFDNFTQSPGIDSNGSIIVTGIFSTYNGSSSPRIARLLSNGTLDPTFIIGTGFNNTTTDVLINPDNSMFVLGYFDSYNGTSVSPGITKLLANGSIDPSFIGGTGIDPYVPNNANYFARIPGETSFYVGGFLTEYDGTTISQIIKLNMDGTVDTSFNSGTGFDGVNLYSLAVIWGDKLIIEGDFLNYNGTPSNYAIILNADGSVYYTFDSTYMSPIVIGDNLFGAEFDDCLELLHTFTPQFCNLEGTGLITVPPTTTTTTTTVPLDCTIIGTGVITVSPTTTTTTTEAPSTTTTTTTEAPLPFISVWRTTAPNQSLTIPFGPGTYTGTIDWGDGNITPNSYANRVHTYVLAGDYTITVSGAIESFSFANYGIFSQTSSLREIQQWGSFRLGAGTVGNFKYCTNLILTNVIDTLNLSGVTELILTFSNCTSLNLINNISSLDLSNITELRNTFEFCTSFNCPLNTLNVSSITSMYGLFINCSVFNQPLNLWDVSNVTDMGAMFVDADAFNQPIGNWNVSNVTNMEIMFQTANAFNQLLDSWNVSSVVSMRSMFAGAGAFNQPLSNWNVSNVTDMSGMFLGSVFNQPIENWNVSNVTDMMNMFLYSSIFNQDLSSWCVTNIPTTPANFDLGASSWILPRPVWGTCPTTTTTTTI